jgi:predicted PurR-regulated permease PerM
MADRTHAIERVKKIILVILALGISVLFLFMIRDLLMALFLAAIASGMAQPLYRSLLQRFGGRSALASAATVGLVLLVVIGPAAVFFIIVTAEAIHLAQVVSPWVSDQIRHAGELDRMMATFPRLRPLAPYRDQILEKLAEVAGNVGSFIVNMVTTAARETATFAFMLFVMLYTMFFFLIDGRELLRKILYYLPLEPEDENRMVGRFLSVARATIKGTLVISVVHGILGGVAFWASGLEAPALWGTLMAVLSAIPGIGSGLVWIPAVVFLGATGRWTPAILLFAWCTAVVGSVDNFLRPWLIGKDTKMPDLLVFLATIGGLALFGATGFVVGPIVAALFVTVWDIYGEAFKDVLPAVEP